MISTVVQELCLAEQLDEKARGSEQRLGGSEEVENGQQRSREEAGKEQGRRKDALSDRHGGARAEPAS